MKLIDVRFIARVRTAEEKRRRHLYGEEGATFRDGKYMTLGGRILGTLTTLVHKDNLIAEIYET